MDAERRAVAWFDGFGFPLTAEEVVRYADEATDRPMSADGFLFMDGRTGFVEERLRRQRYAERKFRRALRVGQILAALPGVRMIAVANTLAFDAARDESDIDLFIVVKRGWLWTFRLLAVGLLKMFGLRPYEGGGRDAICLSFIIDETALDLSPLAIENDRYLAVWVASLVPIFDRDGTYRKFWDANIWIRAMLPNAYPRETSIRRRVRPFVRLPAFGRSPIENIARHIQSRRFPSEIKSMMNRDTRVVATDHILKFHTNDRRAEYRDLWQKKLS